jgi:ribose-phosphate pyrophosphokinase
MSNFSLTGASIDFITFSDGAELCEIKIQDEACKKVLSINVLDVSNDLIRLCLIKDALDSMGVYDVDLFMKYIPNARADRRFGAGQSFSLKVFSNIINSLNFSKVTALDPHSDVSSALIDNIEIISQEVGFGWQLPEIKKISNDFILCAPDVGASKKIFDVMKYIDRDDYIQAVKVRDVSNGNIIACSIPDRDLQGRAVVIVDDICDGGASFIHLSKHLKDANCGKIILYTSHGIYSKGLDPLKGNIDYVFTSNLIEKFVNSRDLIQFNYER